MILWSVSSPPPNSSGKSTENHPQTQMFYWVYSLTRPFDGWAPTDHSRGWNFPQLLDWQNIQGCICWRTTTSWWNRAGSVLYTTSVLVDFLILKSTTIFFIFVTKGVLCSQLTYSKCFYAFSGKYHTYKVSIYSKIIKPHWLRETDTEYEGKSNKETKKEKENIPNNFQIINCMINKTYIYIVHLFGLPLKYAWKMLF